MHCLAKLIATFFYSGKLPKAPGTWGSLLALPFAWALWLLPALYAWPLFILFIAVATWASSAYVRRTGKEDNQEIVVDEAAGIFLTTAFAPHSLLAYAAAFVLFRLFDIWKPFPIRWVDDNIHGGWGVMADDLCAALVALPCMFLLQYFLL